MPLERVGILVFQMPDFIHEFGYEGHHGSLMRTCPRDEDGDYDLRRWKKPIRNWRFEIHEIIEDYVFYPLRTFLMKNDGRLIKLLDIPLTFFWGLLCGFPFKDVVLYTAWFARRCPAVKVWKSATPHTHLNPGAGSAPSRT